jgi:hypothetical protein
MYQNAGCAPGVMAGRVRTVLFTYSSACAYPDALDVAVSHSTSDRALIEVTPMTDFD